jgi:hypothetical protein
VTEWRLATASYSAWRPWMGVPVGTSIGSPKWWTGPTIQDGRSMAPWGRLFDIEDAAEFRTAYRARLHRRQYVIFRQLDELADAYPGVPLILMCFERRPEDCHRSVLAGWLDEMLDVYVPEVTPWD